MLFVWAMSSEPAALQAAKPANRPSPKYPTWEHPKGSGIKIAEMPNRTGGQVFGVCFQVRIPAELLGRKDTKQKDASGKTVWGNGREIHQRKTRKDAEQLAEDRFIAFKKHGTEFSKIPADVQKQAAIAWGKLNEHNLKTKLSLNLIEVVEAGMRILSPTGGLKTFAEVCTELRASKAERLAKGGLDPVSEKDFRGRSTALEAALGEKLVSQISTKDIEDALKAFRARLSQRSVFNYRNTLAEILRHAKAKQYTPTNPLENFTREDYKNLGGEKASQNLDGINILTVEEVRRLLGAAHKLKDTGMLATLVLRLFCGLRTAEVCRLDWSEVHWLEEKPYVHIPAGKAKKRRIRHVEIPANALAWLKLCNPPASGIIAPGSPKGYTRRFARVSKLAGIGTETPEGVWESEWESNDTRHSFGSYHYALHGDSMRTAKEMGHKQNDDTLFAHYRTLVTRENAQDYFAILPPSGASNVTEFPKAATA